MRRLVYCCVAVKFTSSVHSAGLFSVVLMNAGSTTGIRRPSEFRRSNSVNGMRRFVGSTVPAVWYQRRGYTLRLLTRRLTVSTPPLSVIGSSVGSRYIALMFPLTSLVSVTVSRLLKTDDVTAGVVVLAAVVTNGV